VQSGINGTILAKGMAQLQVRIRINLLGGKENEK
jgi:hypothetical protein